MQQATEIAECTGGLAQSMDHSRATEDIQWPPLCLLAACNISLQTFWGMWITSAPTNILVWQPWIKEYICVPLLFTCSPQTEASRNSLFLLKSLWEHSGLPTNWHVCLQEMGDCKAIKIEMCYSICCCFLERNHLSSSFSGKMKRGSRPKSQLDIQIQGNKVRKYLKRLSLILQRKQPG